MIKFLKRVVQVLCASREREAQLVIQRHAHLLAQAKEYYELPSPARPMPRPLRTGLSGGAAGAPART